MECSNGRITAWWKRYVVAVLLDEIFIATNVTLYDLEFYCATPLHLYVYNMQQICIDECQLTNQDNLILIFKVSFLIVAFEYN